MLVVASAASGDAPGLRERVGRYFEEWYPYVPGSAVTVSEMPEIAQPGFLTYRVERRSGSRFHQEVSIVLVDPVRQEVFVGDVFGDPARQAAGRPFDPLADLSNIQASLAEAFGLPVRVTVAGPSRGPLEGIRIAIRQRPDAVLERNGFVSRDGSVLALGEFHALAERPRDFRRRLLSERPGVRLGSGRFAVSEFLDFQCERCRARAPEVEKAVARRGGSIEARFLPLVKNHAWAFAAAESAAAFAALGPDLYAKYREAVFARAESLTEIACRDLAADLAESAGAAPRYRREIESGRARGRVLADILLAMRLGISSTPFFVHDGTLVSGESGLLEGYLEKSGSLAPRR